MKITWKLLIDIIRKLASSSNLPDKFNVNGNISEKKQVANGYNDFFINVGPNLANNIPKQNKDIHVYLNDGNCNTMLLFEITDNEILNMVKT